MSVKLKFILPEKLYLKDPQDSSFGRRLLSDTIDLMHEIGLESFTFKKLAQKMGSAEVSVYRYFENKHLLLLYLQCWYWEWVHYLIRINTLNIVDPIRKMKKVVHSIVFASLESELTDYINEEKLQGIIVQEGSKSYHINDIDKENKEGYFIPFKEMVEEIAKIILEVNPQFKYPRSIATTLFEMTCNQKYYTEHLPRLSDLSNTESLREDLECFLNDCILKTIVQNV